MHAELNHASLVACPDCQLLDLGTLPNGLKARECLELFSSAKFSGNLVYEGLSE